MTKENLKTNSQYIAKGSDGAYGVPTGYKYGKYTRGKRKDDGTMLKKNGRKLGTTLKTQQELSTDVGRIVNLMTFGVTEVKNEKNIEDNVQANKPLKVVEACLELGISVPSFYYYLGRNPAMKEQYQALKENRREYMREV